MKLSVQWLRELVDFPEDVQEFADRLTMLGLEVEGLHRFELAFPGVVVGHVNEAVPHPNADRLRLCRVHTGTEEVSVVCGASNVRAGLKVALALPGATVGELKIKKSKIRGEVSMGMICSERELGLGQGHEGILELPSTAEVGRDLDSLFAYRDAVVEIEITPNRPDLLSHLGVAREVAAYYGGQVRWPDAGAELDAVVKEDQGWSIRIEDGIGCRRFTARLIDGATMGPSPIWMRQRLLAIGQRPINVAVDASNYVLHECGQPNHVFDRRRIKGRQIVLRKARRGETFTTLDDKTHALDPDHLLVADAEGGIALAGIMGGANSEVESDTRDLLLEVAAFDPGTIRRGRRAVNMSTDASYRFERGIDIDLLPWVSRRLAHLITLSCGGQASRQLIEAWGQPLPERARFFVRASQVKRVAGVDLSPGKLAAMVQRLQIAAHAEGQGVWVEQPSFRHDLLEEVDVVEEVARLHGYDEIPTRSRAPMLRPAERLPHERIERRLRQRAGARGFHEVVTSSFMDEKDPDRLGLPPADPRRRTVTILNPIAQGLGQLRTSIVPELLRILERNRSRGATGPIRLFQVGRCFHPVDGAPLPQERVQVAMAWNGPAEPAHFRAQARPFDLYDVLGEVEGLVAGWKSRIERDPGHCEPYHGRGRGLELRIGGTRLGSVGAVDEKVCARYDVSGATFVAELELEPLVALSRSEVSFAPFSAYPPVRRDLSLVMPEGVDFGAVERCLRECVGELLESHEVFDLYEGPGLGGDARAIGVRLSLRSADGTLKDAKVDAVLQALLTELGRRHDIRLR